MILNNIKEAVEFLPSLNLDLANNRLTDFFCREQEWLVNHIIGEEIETLLNTPVEKNQTDSHLDLRRHCQRIIAERALLTAIPEMDMQLTEAGFAVQSNQDFSPASAQRVDRLIAKMPERIAFDVDALVQFLRRKSVPPASDNDVPELYVCWRDTEQFNYLSAAFIPLFEDYNRRALQPAKTYEEFYAAIPIMAKEMKKVADYFVSREEVNRLLELYRDNDALRVHLTAIQELKTVAVAAYGKDIECARNAAVCARDIMLENLDCFPAFAASPAASRKTINLDGGKTVNFL